MLAARLAYQLVASLLRFSAPALAGRLAVSLLRLCVFGVNQSWASGVGVTVDPVVEGGDAEIEG